MPTLSLPLEKSQPAVIAYSTIYVCDNIHHDKSATHWAAPEVYNI